MMNLITTIEKGGINEKERLRQFAGKVGMPLGEFVLNISLVYTEQYEMMAKEQKAVEVK